MTDRQALYDGVSRAAWGYFFLYFDFNLGTVSIFPRFAGYCLFLSAIRRLSGERRDLALLQPLGTLLAVWHAGDWLASWLGGSLNGLFLPLELIISAASLYFHFQLFTDFAALAAAYQPEGEALDRRLLRWRTALALLTTITTLAAYLPDRLFQTTGAVAALAIAALVVALCLMAALFALRRCFREEPETPA